MGLGNTADDANIGDSGVDPQKSTALGGSSGKSGNTAQSVDDNPDPNTNTRTTDPNRNVSDGTGGGGAGANSGGTTSSTSTNDVGKSTMDNSNTSNQTGLHSTSGNLRKGTGGSSSMYGTSDAGNGGFENPIATTLSPEHVAIKNKLTNLSGAEFDKAYMQAMVKDHAKTVELFEAQINKGQNTEVVNFAKMGLPMIKEHYQKAQALSGSKGTMDKNSSTNKGSSSKQ